MFSTDDTIVAVATPAGHGGVGIVRLSGALAATIGARLAGRAGAWPERRAMLARVDAGGVPAESLVTYFEGPASYTGEDVLEIAAPGNPVLLAAIVEGAVAQGARVARPGEFTLRAFLHGRIDLVQAEAVRDLVDAVSPAQARAAAQQLDGSLSGALDEMATALRDLELRLEASLDFPDEGYRFIESAEVRAALVVIRDRIDALAGTDDRAAIVRDGARIVIAGVPNVGKSSVFNALVGSDRAIVTGEAGTTRDLVSERVRLFGRVVEVVDTAGVRTSVDPVEAEGVRRATQAAARADAVLLVLDRSRDVEDEEWALCRSAAVDRTMVVANKSDLPAAWSAARLAGLDVIPVSAKTGEGIATVRRRLSELVTQLAGAPEDLLVTNARQRGLLSAAREAVDHACVELDARGGALPEEFVVSDVRQALGALEEVTGRRAADAMLEEIFATFCIGK